MIRNWKNGAIGSFTDVPKDNEGDVSMNLDISSVRIGIFLALLTLLYGFGLGGAFGAFEDNIKGSLQASAEEVKATVYQGDEAAMKKITDKSWTYMKRAHLHANGLGTAALAIIFVLAGTPASSRVRGVVSTALGIGALGYASFWMFAALRAPAMGSTHDAKESLDWLAIPSAGLCILGLVAVLVLFARHYLLSREAATP
jgi:hypothetical protein